MATIAIVLYKNELMAHMKEEIALWKLDSATEEIRLHIEREIKIITAFCVTNLAIILYGGFAYLEEDPTDWMVFFAMKLCKDYFPNNRYILCLIYRLTFPILAYVSVTHAYQLIYYTQSMKYQGILALYYVENLTTYNTVTEDLKLFYDKQFQKEIRLRLAFLIKRHVELLKY